MPLGLYDSEEASRWEMISFVETPHLAYELEIQRGRMRLGDADEMVPVTLRVTLIGAPTWALASDRRTSGTSQARPSEVHLHL